MTPAARVLTSLAGGFSVYGIEKKRRVRYNKNVIMTAHSVCKERVNMNVFRIGSKKALALFLILMLVFSVSSPSFAANGFAYQHDPRENAASQRKQ